MMRLVNSETFNGLRFRHLKIFEIIILRLIATKHRPTDTDTHNTVSTVDHSMSVELAVIITGICSLSVASTVAALLTLSRNTFHLNWNRKL